MQPYYADDLVTLYHGDCRELLPSITATAMVTDPPYGIGLQTNYGLRQRTALAQSRDYGEGIVGDGEPFDPAHLLAYPTVVLFGANHYADRLPASAGWLVWDKLDGLQSKREVGFNDQADVELAWTNRRMPARLFSHRWMGLMKATERDQQRIHPTQKPVALMRWVLTAVGVTPRDIVVDAYAGSGPTLQAARELGIPSVGIEIEERYCEVIADRLAQDCLALPMPRAAEPAPVGHEDGRDLLTVLDEIGA